MSQNSNNSNNNSNSDNNNNSIPWGTKAKYIGAGLVIGVVIAPLFRKAMEKIQPKVDELFDQMTGKTEGYAERASDLLSRAKEHFRKTEDSHDHGNHDHWSPGLQTVKPSSQEPESVAQENGVKAHE